MTVNTTWVSPVSATLDKTTGSVIDEAMTDGWSSNFYHLGGTAGYIGCRAYHSATQSLTTATATALALNSERFDSDPNGEIHDLVTNNSRLVARTSGLYHIVGHVSFASNATGYRDCAIRLNGSTFLAATALPAVNGTDHSMTITSSWLLNASDYVELIATQTSGGALNVLASSGYQCELSITKA